MPLVGGVDARGRPIYIQKPTDPTQINGGGVSPAALIGAVDTVDPGNQPAQAEYKSQVDYSGVHNSTDTIKQMGEAATQRAQQAAAAAVQARLAAAQNAANTAVGNAAKSLGSSQIPGGTIIKSGVKSKGGSSTGPVNATDLRARLVAKVASQKGVDYQWGGESPKSGFDCSGLVQWAYGKLGIKMPRVSGQQAHMGRKAPISKLRPGDLVAHPGHIAVYAGNGMMWEAPHTGAQVRLVPVRRDMYGVKLNLPGD
jgi:cell wall-associated NlpC family hydrolase